jgi:hypothetical protein
MMIFKEAILYFFQRQWFFIQQLTSRDVLVARSGSIQPVFFKVELIGDSPFDWTLFCGSIRRTLYLPIDYRLKLVNAETNSPIFSQRDLRPTDKILVLLHDE